MVQDSGNITRASINSGGELPNLVLPNLFKGFPAPQFRPKNFCDAERPVSELVWFPRGLPTGKSIGIASSRLGKNLDEQDDWFDALRTLAVKLDPQTDFLLTAAGTTTDVYLRHLCRRFGFSAVELFPWTESVSLDFIRQQTASVQNESDQNSIQVGLGSADERVFPAYYLPLPGSGGSKESFDPVVAIKNFRTGDFQFDRDWLLIEVAADCYLLSIRPHGKIHLATCERIADENRSGNRSGNRLGPAQARTWITLSKKANASAVQRQLLDSGAVGWWLYDQASDAASDAAIADLESPSNSLSRNEAAVEGPPILELAEFPSENFLIHWTRDRPGPWPNQTDEEWLDDLIFRAERRKHGATFALRRILATRQILASRRMTRDEQPVVCLSNRSLRELGELTVYRQHLGRWDFMPFGVAVDREWLAKLGARPVIYGADATWKSLPETDRPFFQLANSKSGKIDWTIEQEWRWLGNLNLRQAPQQAVAVFVPSMKDAREIASICHWPIVVLGIDLKKKKS